MPSPGARNRDAYLDNARYLAMLLVVVGHVWFPMSELGTVHAAYVWIYLFHMPVFVLLAGYTSRSFVGRPDQVRRLVGTMLVPYLVVELATRWQQSLHGDAAMSWDLMSPTWLAWFLLALFVWRLTTPLWASMRWPVLAAVAVSLLGGLVVIGDAFALSQVVGFLPFYVAGLALRPQHLEVLRDYRVKIPAAITLVMSFALVWIYHEQTWATADWIYWRDAYTEPGVASDNLHGLAIRAGLLVAGFALGGAFLALIPRRRLWFTALGAATLYCYLLHGFVVRELEHAAVTDVMMEIGWLGAIAMAVLMGAVGTALMSPPVVRWFRPVFEPRLGWLFPTQEQPSRPSSVEPPVVEPRTRLLQDSSR